MLDRAKSLWLDLSQSLGFIPGFIVVLFGALGIGLVEVDNQVDLDGVTVVFSGDGSAARTVLSVIAGSLITVAGLTFSITMVVLQLASSQFSPRLLRTFFGDRITQITIGTYVGTFVYSILVLRAIGSFGDAGFVPRLSVTVAALLGIGAVVLLIVYLHHVSQMVQVSHVMADVAHATLKRTNVLYPETFGEPVDDEEAERCLREWRREPPGAVYADRPGFVQRIGIDALMEELGGRAQHVAVLVCPGDFAPVDQPIAEVWPASAADDCRGVVLGAVAVASERDLNQDVDFGLRQLADTALKAMSPGINDPMTAVTCIRYMRAVLARLTARSEPERLLRHPSEDMKVALRRREFVEYLDVFLQLNRYIEGDAWVAVEILQALDACAAVAEEGGARERLRVVQRIASIVGRQAAEGMGNDHDREQVRAHAAKVAARACG